jgi:hypothetical protein
MPLSTISIEKQLHYAEQGEQGGVNIREPSTAILGISSIDRYRAGLNAPQVNPITGTLGSSLSSPYDFQITTPGQNLMSGYFTRLAVNEVQFRWTLPTLTNRNNKMYIYIAPNNNFSLTAVAHSGSTTTFTLSSTTGYAAGQTIQVLSGDVLGRVVSGTYIIASTTGTTLVCNDPNGLPDFTTTAVGGNVFVRGLITVPDGWYDIYNQDITSVSRGGNLAYQFQQAVRGITSIASLVDVFTCVYNLQYQGTNNTVPPLTVLDVNAVGQPYNTFFASNLASTGASVFFFGRYPDPLRPNAVGLFEMMAWNNSQLRRTFQFGSPNVSYLSTPFVDICCDGLTYNQSLKDGDSGDIARTMLCRVFLTPDAFTGNVANLGSAPILIHRSFPFPKQIKWNANQPIGNLRFQVFDSQGYLLTTGEGLTGTMENPPNSYDSDLGDWTMTLLVSEV